MPAIVVAFLLALAALGGGAAAHSALPPDDRGEVAAWAAQLVSSLQPVGEAGSRSTRASSSSRGSLAAGAVRVSADEPISGTVPITGTQPITGTTPTPVPTATVPITPSVPATGTVSAPDDQGARHQTPITGAIQITLTKTISDVLGLADDPNVSGKSEEGLAAKLLAVRRLLARGNANAAQNALDAFLHELNAFQRSGRLDPASYAALYDEYQTMVMALGGTPRPQATPKAEHGSERAAAPDGDSPGRSVADNVGADGDHGQRGRGKPAATPVPTVVTPQGAAADRGHGHSSDSTKDSNRSGHDGRSAGDDGGKSADDGRGGGKRR